MAYYNPRTSQKYKSSGYNKGAADHMRERRELSREVYGLDSEIIAMIFRLPLERKEKLLCIYQKAHGSVSSEYAREAWNDWARKSRGISGQTAKRFISLVPKIFSFEERYDLVAKLYASTRRVESHYLEIVIGCSEESISQIEPLFNRLCSKPLEHKLPESVTKFVAWVSDNDSITSRKLMAAIETENSLAVVKSARVEISRLINAIRDADQRIHGQHEIGLPYGSITISVRFPNTLEKIKRFFK